MFCQKNFIWRSTASKWAQMGQVRPFAVRLRRTARRRPATGHLRRVEIMKLLASEHPTNTPPILRLPLYLYIYSSCARGSSGRGVCLPGGSRTRNVRSAFSGTSVCFLTMRRAMDIMWATQGSSSILQRTDCEHEDEDEHELTGLMGLMSRLRLSSQEERDGKS